MVTSSPIVTYLYGHLTLVTSSPIVTYLYGPPHLWSPPHPSSPISMDHLTYGHLLTHCHLSLWTLHLWSPPHLLSSLYGYLLTILTYGNHFISANSLSAKMVKKLCRGVLPSFHCCFKHWPATLTTLWVFFFFECWILSSSLSFPFLLF